MSQILVVEDEAAIAELISLNLRHAGYEVTLAANAEQAQAAHAHLRNWLAARYNPALANATRILYGGSVKADNAATLLAQPDIDGALVGGASLTGKAFVPIIEAAVAAKK